MLKDSYTNLISWWFVVDLLAFEDFKKILLVNFETKIWRAIVEREAGMGRIRGK